MNHNPPQRELGYVGEPFALVQQTAVDGERVASEAKAKQADQAEADKKQLLIDGQ